MIGLIMCGGKGTRFKSPIEKLLLKYKKPMIELVLNAFKKSEIFSQIICVTSNNAPKTREFVLGLGISTLETKGNGYVSDLNEALLQFDELTFISSGDMPLLDSEVIKKIVDLVDTKNLWTSILVSKNFLSSLRIEAEFFVNYNGLECAYTGISVVDAKKIKNLSFVNESFILLNDKRVAINMNTQKDFDLICAT